MGSPLEVCHRVVGEWFATAYRHHCYRQMFVEQAPPWPKHWPTMESADAMRRVLTYLLKGITEQSWQRATVYLTNDNQSGCILIIDTEDARRVVVKVIEDGTTDVRSYRFGEFQYGMCIWADGYVTEYIYEPLEVL